MVGGDSIGGMLNIFWVFLMISMLIPLIKKKFPDAARLKLIQTMEKKRGSRVITMIHRQEMMAILGFPLFKYIDIEDSEQVLRAIRLTPMELYPQPAGRCPSVEYTVPYRDEKRSGGEGSVW
uniref:Uncharacterized protein n=1 Tax=uncultured Methanosarcinales archaeon TaxID=183757 RepID=A0A7H1KP22_9EURY|nr:hypothetical protein HAHEADPM_00020 [uncultured Methanosarcinales archaeon]